MSLLDAAGAPPSMAVWAMMETPKGILRAEEIAGAHPRLALFVMGTNDLVKDMRARHTPMRLPMVTALGLGMLAARAYGLTILDGVYNDIQDTEGFRAVCQQGLEMGFDGKTLIHPSQVEPCNEVFAPSAAELEMAGKIVAAFKAGAGRRQGRGHGRRPHDREPACRAGRARAGAGRGDQGAAGSGMSSQEQDRAPATSSRISGSARRSATPRRAP